MSFTLGADPEVFLTDGKSLISAIGRVPGTKDSPVKTEWGKVHVDNVAAEFNTIPAISAEEFDNNVKMGLEGVFEIARGFGLTVSTEAFGVFSKEDLSHPYAKMAGCEPDYCAYDGSMNDTVPLQFYDERAAGGHIHVGTELTDADVPKLVKCLDLFLGIPLLERENPDRRFLYGKAGAFRRKPYGVEYRTPSNAWIFASEDRRWAFNAVKRALEEFRSIRLPSSVPKVINEHDLATAKTLMQEFSL